MNIIIRILADAPIVVIFLIACYMFIRKIPRPQWRWWWPRIILAGATTYLVKEIISHVFPIEQLRPFETLGVQPGAFYLQNGGFPSDHALFAMFLVLAVWYSTRNKPVTIVLFVLAALMGLGRVLAHVHTPIDIIGGFVVAFVGIFWYYIGRNKLDALGKK